MSEFNYNLRGASDSVFKVPTLPSRYRKTNCNYTQSTYNNDVGLPNCENTYNTFKKVEERYEVLKKICPPEDVEKILLDTVDRLTEACYEKMAEQLVRPSQSQAFSVGGSSVYSANPRPSVPNADNYGTSILNVQDQPTESSRRRINSTAASKNHYGLLNAPITERPSNFPSCDQFSRPNDIILEAEPTVKSFTQKSARAKKKVTPVNLNEETDKRDPVAGLSIPLRTEKPNPPTTLSRRNSNKKQASIIKDLEVLPSEDESDSLSVFFGKGRNAASKPSTSRVKQIKAVNKNDHIDLSVSLNRVKVNDSSSSQLVNVSSRKRKASQNDEVSSRKKSPVVVQEKDPSPDTTTKISEPKHVKASSSETVRKTKRNTSVAASKKIVESSAKAKENKENKEKVKAATVKSKSQKEIQNEKKNATPMAEKDTQPNTVNEEEVLDDGSFFGDVSSIVGLDSILLSNSLAKSTTKHTSGTRNEMPSHFFSPFANIRSTSGVSAISTPLSKTMSKNVLGKRLKKPSVVAELKGTQTRKPRKVPLKANIVPIAKSSSESSEYDPEGSDFSD